MPSLLGTIADAFAENGVDLAALGLAWARVVPSVVLVPAFGLRALPAPARAIIALALAASIFPALAPSARQLSEPWLILALGEIVRGLPIAIAAAVPLWAATMAGGVADALRGTQNDASSPVVEGRATPLGIPLSLLACALFLASGGPSRIATALASRPFPAHPLLGAAHDIASGITLAVSIGGPLLAASVVIELAAALVARAASPAQLHALVAPLRALGVLAVMGIVLDRVAGVMAVVVADAP